jgi:hypothetical protein
MRIKDSMLFINPKSRISNLKSAFRIPQLRAAACRTTTRRAKMKRAAKAI